MLYFSYGSNMSIKRLRERAPSAQLKAIATLYEHDLRFHKKSQDGSGKCDAYATNNPDDFIVGVVFDIAEAEKLELDRMEVLGYGYGQKEVTLMTRSGEIIYASTYYAMSIDPTLKPYHWYKHHVLTGACENGLPEEYINRISHVPSAADPDAERHDREMAIYVNKSL